MDPAASVDLSRVDAFAGVGLVAVTGSRMYGMARPDSDVDLRGFFVAPTELLLGTGGPAAVADSVRLDDPDVVLFEVGRLVRMGLNADPTILETLASPLVLRSSPLAEVLRENVAMFFSNLVRDRFGGFANAQFRKAAQREDRSFSSDTRNRTAKHALHLFRVLEQGEGLLRTGRIDVVVKDPDRLRYVSSLPFDKMREEFQVAFDRFKAAPSVLPDRPDVAKANKILVEHRLSLLDRATVPGPDESNSVARPASAARS